MCLNIGKTLRTVSDGLIMAHIRYCVSAYGPENVRISVADPVTGTLHSLQNLQNKMLRIISNATDRTPIKEMLEQNKMMSINQVMAYNVLMDLWKARSFGVCSIKKHFSERNSLRYADNFQINRDSGSFTTVAAKLWEITPMRFRQTNLLKVAKQELKEFIKGRIPH